MEKKYGFIGRDYWRQDGRKFTDFKKQFSKQIAKDDMKAVWEWVRKKA